jgi:hypothetical protein
MQIMEDPYPETPGERQERIDEVKSEIDGFDSIPQEIREALKAHAQEFVAPRLSVGHGHFYGGQLGWTHWVIKNDDLNLAVQLSPTAVAVATFFTAVGASPWVLAVGLIMTGVALTQKFMAKNVKLDESDYGLVMTLKEIGPSSVTDLTKALNGISIYNANLWTDEKTLAALSRLKQMRQGDGSTTALVSDASDGLWSTSGV